MSDSLEVTRLKGRVRELEKTIEGMTRKHTEREAGFYAQIADLKARIQHQSDTICAQNEE